MTDFPLLTEPKKDVLTFIDVCRLGEIMVDITTNKATSKDTIIIVLDKHGLFEPDFFFGTPLDDFKTLDCENSGEKFEINQQRFIRIKRAFYFVHDFCLNNKIKDGYKLSNYDTSKFDQSALDEFTQLYGNFKIDKTPILELLASQLSRKTSTVMTSEKLLELWIKGKRDWTKLPKFRDMKTFVNTRNPWNESAEKTDVSAS